LVNPIVVGRIVLIGTSKVLSKSEKGTKIISYLIKRKITKIALGPTIEGVAVAVFDRRNLLDARNFVDLKKNSPAVRRGGPFPTTNEAVDAYTDAINGLRRKDTSIVQKSRKFIRRAGRAGFTPFVPIIGASIAGNVALNLGVPRWVILTSKFVSSI